VKAGNSFIVSAESFVSILFDPQAVDAWLEALEDQDHVTDFYIVTSDNRVFNGIKAQANTLLGDVSVTESVKRPMSEGFLSNVEYFKLGFLDKDRVSIGRQFKEILPLLWMKAGAVGIRPELATDDLPGFLVLPENNFAVLLDVAHYGEFSRKIEECAAIKTVYFAIDSAEAFEDMAEGVGNKRCFQLYCDYIDNFVLGNRRGSQCV
jgi:adenine-specific DNA-methyltransferase